MTRAPLVLVLLVPMFAACLTDPVSNMDTTGSTALPRDGAAEPPQERYEEEETPQEPLFTIHAVTVSLRRAAPRTVLQLREGDLLTNFLRTEDRATTTLADHAPRSRLLLGFALETRGVPPFYPYPELFE